MDIRTQSTWCGLASGAKRAGALMGKGSVDSLCTGGEHCPPARNAQHTLQRAEAKAYWSRLKRVVVVRALDSREGWEFEQQTSRSVEGRSLPSNESEYTIQELLHYILVRSCRGPMRTCCAQVPGMTLIEEGSLQVPSTWSLAVHMCTKHRIVESSPLSSAQLILGEKCAQAAHMLLLSTLARLQGAVGTKLC